MSWWGTSYFVSRSAAERYYKSQGYDDAKETVRDKIRSGDIHIGRPPVKAGQRVITVDGGKRYAIEEKQNPARRGRVTTAPIMKVLRESGAKKVRVMRSKSGKPVGLKFL